MDDLSRFLNLQMAQPFVWGVSDCCLMAADWVALRYGADPAADLRQTYDSRSECQRVTRFFTDPVALIAPRLQRMGLVECSVPGRGDVAVVLAAAEGRRDVPHGAVYVGGGGHWAFKGQSGVVVTAAVHALRIWEVGCV